MRGTCGESVRSSPRMTNKKDAVTYVTASFFQGEHSISRVLSHLRGDDYLSSQPIARLLKRRNPEGQRATSTLPYSVLLRMGFTKPAGLPTAGALLPHRFSFSPACAGEFTFLWHFPSGNPWEIPVSRFHGTRCLVMSGLSSTPVRRPEQRPPEPDRHGLHTLSSARGKAQSRHGKNFVSFFLPLPSSSQWAPSSLNKAKRPQDCSRGRSNLLPMKTSLIH